MIIAGWASNSKYPFYWRLRAAAQMVSYEVSIGFVLIPVVLWVGDVQPLRDRRGAAAATSSDHQRLRLQSALLFPLAVIFLISAMAETARAPFDLTEAESELVAGYQTEYSSMSFALFWLGEYGNVLLMCGMNAVLFWGGWLPPIDWAPLYVIPGHRLVLRQDPVLLLRLLLGEGDRAALPLRPADAARLEDLPAHLADLGVPGLGLSDAQARYGMPAMVSRAAAPGLLAAAAPAAPSRASRRRSRRCMSRCDAAVRSRLDR